MWLILFWLLCTIGVAFERAMYLFGAQQDTDVFIAAVLKFLESKNVKMASYMAKNAKSPLGNIVLKGLHAEHAGADRIQTAMDQQALTELPRMKTRIPYLALFANLSMLCGLFGTIIGLIKSFGAVGGESVDPSDKSRILAEGIAEAMSCTAFGLMAAIIALACFAGLNNWLQVLEDDIHEVTVKVRNTLVDLHQRRQSEEVLLEDADVKDVE